MTDVELYMEIVAEGGPSVVCSSMTEEDVTTFLAHPNVTVSSDGGINARHPWGAGPFPRVLAKYVREEEALTNEHNVRLVSLDGAVCPGVVLRHRRTDDGRDHHGQTCSSYEFPQHFGRPPMTFLPS
jgi:N-acyl-D-aspartate/D-glutamate deacylase